MNTHETQFHPITQRWFDRRFQNPTECQKLGWPEILNGRNTLIAAPTGSGKTLAAFMVCIDRLLRSGLDHRLEDATSVVYVSPLKALSNDVRRNLEVPLNEIRATAQESGVEVPDIRVQVRTGDTSTGERQAMLRKPPHILVTTPESLYLMLTAERSRKILSTTQTVIVDEIHALARDKRGSHFTLSLERLEALCSSPPVRIGLSATQKPIEDLARFLVGSKRINAEGEPDCKIVDTGHVRDLDLAIESPPSELSAVCSYETWDEIYARMAELIRTHRSTLIFVNTRRLAERVSHHLRQIMGDDSVASHHGSLSRQTRLAAEERLKAGQLKAIVATASLELGIDIGYIDLVCQLGSPRSIATFLQRVGRSGHALHVTPKGRIFPMTRDELIECMALMRAVRSGRLDRVEIPQEAIDVLAQQIVAAVACEEWNEDALYELIQGAWPYRNFGRGDYNALLTMLSEGIGQGGRRGKYLHRDVIHKRLRPRRSARIAAITSGGAIPETADYRVIAEPDMTYVGTIHEDFAIESMAGDIFLLGNTSWRIRHVRGGEVTVQDAQGAPATIPFWLGEAPARTTELSEEVSLLREELERKISDEQAATEWLVRECCVSEWGASQVRDYIAAEKAAIGLVPSQARVVFERFFDEAGGMQLVIHAPFGSRINRAWGLALRKRFCRQFNFELQASANDNGIVLSLGPQHSFPLEQMFGWINASNAKYLLVQALLAVPVFQVRWRWNATRALAVLRQRGGKRVPPPLQRFQSDDLLSAVFPEQTACLENQVGDIEVPDHPLVRQTVTDCLSEAMDLDKWLDLLSRIQSGEVELIARDTTEPSPFCYELLNVMPYAFLDDAPLEERRARAVATRRTLTVESVRDLATLDPQAIHQVRSEAWPLVRDADELHDALMESIVLPASEGAQWTQHFHELRSSGRATEILRDSAPALWCASERWPIVKSAFDVASSNPPVTLPDSLMVNIDTTDAWVGIVRGRLFISGPTTDVRIAADLGMDVGHVRSALESLEGEGFALRGKFAADSGSADETEWCERRLLARIHRLTLDGLRQQIQPVSPEEYIQFLIGYQHLDPETRMQGMTGVLSIIRQLEGFEAPAATWEKDILNRRVVEYDFAILDELSMSGEVVWARLHPPQVSRASSGVDGEAPLRANALSRVVPVSLMSRKDLPWLQTPPDRSTTNLRGSAQVVKETLEKHGALFFDDLRALTGLLPAHLEEGLSELAAQGMVTADGFAAIRSLVSPNRRRVSAAARRWTHRGVHVSRPHAQGGRWSLFPRVIGTVEPEKRIEEWAHQLLKRYGVVFRDLLAQESVAPHWSDLSPVYRRLEARGEIRGGLFVSGVGGEQYAAPEAVGLLRDVRKKRTKGDWTIISASDPVNLSGILTKGPRIPAIGSNYLIIHEGRVIASRQAKEIIFHETVSPEIAEEMTRALRRA